MFLLKTRRRNLIFCFVRLTSALDYTLSTLLSPREDSCLVIPARQPAVQVHVLTNQLATNNGDPSQAADVPIVKLNPLNILTVKAEGEKELREVSYR